ncbi:hypothetical protein [Alteromonas lipolytica]|nr:hypothetical protein [Alteromonas lipolytica]
MKEKSMGNNMVIITNSSRGIVAQAAFGEAEQGFAMVLNYQHFKRPCFLCSKEAIKEMSTKYGRSGGCPSQCG